jgi:TonB family protein
VVEERRDIIGAFLEAAERKPFIYDPEEPMEMPDPGNRRLKILSKPRASYTDKARMNGISGTVNLMVLFAANGTIPYIIVVKSLDPGLDREAVKAARNIKFEPMTRDGKPASKVVVIQYGFTIY